jgi:hypothetical protein
MGCTTRAQVRQKLTQNKQVYSVNIVNYRPIALCQCSYKFFSQVLLKKIKQHAEKKQIISQSQFGIRKNATIYKVVLTYLEVINDDFAKNKDLYTLSLDITKAYDSPKVL